MVHHHHIVLLVVQTGIDLVELAPRGSFLEVPLDGLPRQGAAQVAVHVLELHRHSELLPLDAEAQIDQQRHGAFENAANRPTGHRGCQVQDPCVPQRRR